MLMKVVCQRSLYRPRLIKLIVILALLLILSLSVRSHTTTLNVTTAPLYLENLGVLVESASIQGKLLIREPQTDQTHLLMHYVAGEIWKQPFQTLDVNLATGETRVVEMVLGRPGPNATLLHSSGLVYIASGDPGYLIAYHPKTGQTQTLGKLADKGAQYLIEGDDGAIYLGECVKGCVERYNPQDNTWENYGIIDDPGPPYYRYAYTLGADGRYVYIAVGQSPWYLVVYDRLTREQTVHWKDLHANVVNVYPGVDGQWYAYLSTAGGSSYFTLHGNDVRPADFPGMDLRRMPLSVQSWDKYKQWAEFPYDLDLDHAYPYNANQGQATIRWRPRVEPLWQATTATLRTAPMEIKRLYDNGSNLFGFTSFYGPVFTYDPVTGQTKILGRPQRSLYDALFSAGLWFLAGYPATTLRFDPELSWTLTETSLDLYDLKFNPRLLSIPSEGMAKYHYFLAQGANGSVYIGGHHERSAVGGSLGWYDPITGEAGGLREPFLQHDASDLLAIDGGNKLILSGKGVQSGIEGKLFVFNAKHKRVENDFVALPGEREAGKIAAVEDDTILGVVKNATSGDKIYKLNMGTQEVIFVIPLEGQAFGNVKSCDRRLVKGPDGSVWFYIDNTICRFNPADGTGERIIDAAPAGNLVFFNNDLYIYGGPCLRRIPGILQSGSPGLGSSPQGGNKKDGKPDKPVKK